MLLESLLQSFGIAKAGCGYRIDKRKRSSCFFNFRWNENAWSCMASKKWKPPLSLIVNQQKSAQSDDDDPFKRSSKPDRKTWWILASRHSTITRMHEELIGEMNNENGDNADYRGDDDENALLNPVCPKVSDIREALQVLHDYMPFSLSSEDIW